jgi:hypothetical protein
MSIMGDGCSEQTAHKTQQDQVIEKQKKQRAYIPHNDVELRNYNDAQRLYDSPDTIIWCSTTWGNASAPLVTVPVTGKLTSSTTSFFPSTKWVDRGDYTFTEVQTPSIDGMYHPNPPQYRYGFTPGGQYVDFFNMPTFCTTALTKFQRQATKVTVEFDAEARVAQKRAEAALRNGDEAGAQRVLQEALGG